MVKTVLSPILNWKKTTNAISIYFGRHANVVNTENGSLIYVLAYVIIF